MRLVLFSSLLVSIMKGFTRLPITLYRIQPSLPVRLRDFDTQMAKGRSSFDLKVIDGLVRPVPLGSEFTTPNGMSLRPSGDKMRSILGEFKGSPRVYRMHEGFQLPEGLIVYHEHSDHYSLQTSVPVSLDDYNQRLTELLEKLPSQTKEQFCEQYDDPEDQDN